MVLQNCGEDLYLHVEKAFNERVSTIVKPIVSAPHETFLKEMISIWSDYQQATEMVCALVMYLDRNYVPSKKKLPIYDNGVQVYKHVVLQDNKQGNRTLLQILNLIQSERQGKQIDRMLMKSVVSMLYDTKSYEDFLEQELLKVTRQFYKAYGDEISSKSTVPEYLEKAHEKVQEENKRVDYYLKEQTRKKFEDILKDELVSKHMDFIIESSKNGFQSLIADDKYEDLKRMFELFSFDKEHLETLREKFKAYCHETGKKYVSDVEKASQPIEYIKGLFELKQKYDLIVEKSFRGNPNFMKSLNEAVEQCVNGFPRFSEFLSKFLDSMIRNIQTFDKKAEDDLERGMVFFRMLNDKDVFENNYKIELSRRLLPNRDDIDGSLQAEKFFITRLKLEQGHAFTSKIEGMLNDMKLSSKTMAEYQKSKKYSMKEKDINFVVNVLTTNFWPSFMLSSPNLPTEMQKCCDSFEAFYAEQYPGRKVTWQASIGSGVVQSLFPLGSYNLHLSTYQIMILMLVNEDPNLTFKTIVEKTKVNEKDLKRNLLALYAGKHKILLKSGDPKDITDNDVITINLLFKSDKTDVRIFGASTTKEGSSSSGSSTEEKEKLQSERLPQIDKSILKVMKLKEKYNRTQLQTDVLVDLKSRFQCDPQDILKRVDELVKQGMLAHEKESNLITYLKE